MGIVPDEKGRGLESPTDVGAYASFMQNRVAGLGLVARGSGDGGSLIQSVSKALTRVDKTQVWEARPEGGGIKNESTMQQRLAAALLGGLSVLAMLLACAGIYGVLSFVRARRRHEMAIRAALGATRATLVGLVVTGGSRTVALRIVAGIGGAVGLTRYILACGPGGSDDVAQEE